MPDSENKKPEANESPEQSPEPSPQSSPRAFVPQLGLRELTATWEMLIEFRKAIIENDHWSGSQTQAVAMGLELLKKMEAQYRVQVELSREHEKQMAKKAREEINAAGGKVSGEPQTLNPA